MNRVAVRLRKSIAENWRQLLLSFVSSVVFLVAWWLYAAYLRGDWPFPPSTRNPGSYETLPYWWDVLKTFARSFTHPTIGGLQMPDHILASLKRIFAGFVIALITAVPLGLIMGRSRNAEAAARPILEIFRPIPPLAWVGIFLIVFGIYWGPAAIVFLGIFFPVLLSVRLGAKSVDPVLMDAARTLGAKRYAIFTKVVLPFTVPYLMTGITLGLGIGWMCIVAAEMLGAVGGGVGYLIWQSSQTSQYDVMYAGMLMIAILSVLTTGIAELMERWIRRWMGLR